MRWWLEDDRDRMLVFAHFCDLHLQFGFLSDAQCVSGETEASSKEG
jgi:hypothetical protein